MSLAGTRVAFANYPVRDQDQSDVAVLDLNSGDIDVVARSGFEDGNASWPEIDGDWVVYVDRDRIPDASAPGLRWSVRAINLVTGERTLLSSSNGEDLQSAPAPIFRDGYAVWSESIDRSDPSKGLRAYVWKPGWERKRLIPESKDVYQGRVVGDQLVHRRIVWLEGGAYEDRVFTMPLDGSRPARQLSPDGSSVEWMSAADGVAVWSTLGEGFPEEHVARPIDGSGPGVRIQEGPSNSNVQVGEGFAAWMQTGSGVTVSTLDGEQQEVLRRGTFHVPSRLAVDDDRLAFVTRAGSRLTLHVVGVDAD